MGSKRRKRKIENTWESGQRSELQGRRFGYTDLQEAKRDFPEVHGNAIRSILKKAEAESKKHLELGIESIRSLVKVTLGNLVGGVKFEELKGEKHDKIHLENPENMRGIARRLADGFEPVFDDELIVVRGSYGDTEDKTAGYFNGQKVFSHKSCAERGSHFSIFGMEVYEDDYNCFIKEVRQQLEEAGLLNKRREVPKEIQERIQEGARMNNMDHTMVEAQPVPSLSSTLFVESPPSETWSFVEAYDLKDWCNWIVTQVELVSKDEGDTGKTIEIDPDTLVIICGGDKEKETRRQVYYRPGESRARNKKRIA